MKIRNYVKQGINYRRRYCVYDFKVEKALKCKVDTSKIFFLLLKYPLHAKILYLFNKRDIGIASKRFNKILKHRFCLSRLYMINVLSTQYTKKRPPSQSFVQNRKRLF